MSTNGGVYSVSGNHAEINDTFKNLDTFRTVEGMRNGKYYIVVLHDAHVIKQATAAFASQPAGRT